MDAQNDAKHGRGMDECTRCSGRRWVVKITPTSPGAARMIRPGLVTAGVPAVHVRHVMRATRQLCLRAIGHLVNSPGEAGLHKTQTA
jgi:hypothetical protein